MKLCFVYALQIQNRPSPYSYSPCFTLERERALDHLHILRKLLSTGRSMLSISARLVMKTTVSATVITLRLFMVYIYAIKLPWKANCQAHNLVVIFVSKRFGLLFRKRIKLNSKYSVNAINVK